MNNTNISNKDASIYAIQHTVTKRIYVGVSKDVKARIAKHLYELRRKRHINELMQSDFDRYGEEYDFFLLEEINLWNEKCKEFEYMEKYKTYDSDYGYNYKDPHFTRRNKSYDIEFQDGEPIPNEEV